MIENYKKNGINMRVMRDKIDHMDKFLKEKGIDEDLIKTHLEEFNDQLR